MSAQEYSGQLFSILGDSISTLEGYSEPRDAEFYTGYTKIMADVFDPEDTWWGRVLNHFDAELLVNNSISGSMVTKHADCEIPSYGCSDERIASLAKDGKSPDVIIVFLGINDWGYGIPPRPEYEIDSDNLSVFSVAYSVMLDKIRTAYPKVQIWCLTLPVSTCTARADFVFPYRRFGKHISEFSDVITECAMAYGCRLIDLYRQDMPHDTIDGFHPNRGGMATLAKSLIDRIENS